MQVRSTNFSKLSIAKASKITKDESFDEKIAGNFERLGIEEKYTNKKKEKKEQSSIISQERDQNINLRPEVAALEAVIASKQEKNLKNSKPDNLKTEDITAKLINAANKAEGQENLEDLKNLKFKDILSQVIKDANNKENLDKNSKLENLA